MKKHNMKIKEVGFPEAVDIIAENYENGKWKRSREQRKGTALGLATDLLGHNKTRAMYHAIIVTRPLIEVWNPYTPCEEHASEAENRSRKLAARLVIKPEHVKIISGTLASWLGEERDISNLTIDVPVDNLHDIKERAYEFSKHRFLKQDVALPRDRFPLPYSGKEPRKIYFFEAVDLIVMNNKGTPTEDEKRIIAKDLARYLMEHTSSWHSGNTNIIMRPEINIYNGNREMPIDRIAIRKDDMKLVKDTLVNYNPGYIYDDRKEDFAYLANQLALPPEKRNHEKMRKLSGRFEDVK